MTAIAPRPRALTLKEIPTPEEKQENVQEVTAEQEQYINETRVNVKPSLWERFKNTKVIRAIRYVMKIKVVLEFPALPEPTQEQH